MRRVAAVLVLLILSGCGRAAPAAEVCPVSREPELPEVPAAGYVALTFDDGPSRHTARLLDGLGQRGVRATFFLVGERLAGNEALVQRMRAEGHQIGNHSYGHGRLDLLDRQQALADLTRCDLALCTVLGEGDYWVRPPYGCITADTAAALAVPVVCWSVDPRDWECRDAEAIAAQIGTARDGDIILLHDCYAATVDGVLQAIDRLQERGLQCVTVAELLQRRGICAAAGEILRRAK